MRRKAKRSPPAAGNDNGAHQRKRRWWRLWLLAALAALSLWGGFAWRQHAVVSEIRTGLPARPEVASWPAKFVEQVAAAETMARTPSTALSGVTELGRLYHANGFKREAEACWHLMLDRQPREPRWRYYLADLRRAESDNTGMTAFLRQTLELAPDYSPAHLQLANLQLKLGDLTGAERDYRARLALVPRDPYATLGLVRIALQRKRTEEARALLEEILKDAPNFATAHNLYAEILTAAGETNQANWHRWLGVETLRYVEPADPWLDEMQLWCYDYDRLCVLGSVASLRENQDQAKELYERAIELSPDELDAYQLLSVTYLKQERPEQARDLLEQARSRVTKGDLTPLFTQLCRAYRMLRQLTEAERLARQGLAQIGDKAELFETLGLILADMERHQEAVAAYEAALARNPNDASTNYNLAVSLLSLRRLDDVLEALDRSLTLQPTFPPTLLLRGRIEMAAGHWEQAERCLRPVFESHPENTEARRLLAGWHRHMGEQAEQNKDLASAERHYREGSLIDPHNVELLGRLGAFYLVHARFADAVEPLESWHRLQPGHAQGCLLLGQAYAGAGRQEQAREVLAKGALLADQTGDARTAARCREAARRLP